MDPTIVDVAVIGAGPNGLGLSIHLQQLDVDHRIFGSPMKTWLDMPATMNLKSLGFATTIPTPDGRGTFPEYCRRNGLEDYEPIEFATFAEYGLEMQRTLVPKVENALVTQLSRDGDGFALVLDTGERVRARRVVVAVGLTYFARVPAVFAGLSQDRVAHTWGLNDLSSYAGEKVIVIGAGSSALETATLLHEHGASVQVLARGEVHWGGHSAPESERTLLEKLKLPVTSLGHGRENWVLQHVPWLMHYVPDSKRLPFTRRHLGPGPAWWLHERAEGQFPIRNGTQVVAAKVSGGEVRLDIEGPDGPGHEVVDRVVLGTGYAFDVDKLSFIDSAIARDIRRHDLSPRLTRHFESSVSGLYFVGPVAAESFGPLVRFVAGAPYAVPKVARHLARDTARQGRR